MNFNPIIETQDDNFVTKEVGDWAIQKHSLIGGYCDLFTKTMDNKWNDLVYIDLFAGCGYSRIRNSNKIIYGSPLVALSVPVPFSKYIFCEKDPALASALSKRVSRSFPDKNVTIFNGDSNEIIDQIKQSIPQYSKQNTVLSFCFVDPYSLNLSFKTIQTLGSLRIDFLILLALYMDANRNFKIYLKEENKKIEAFLGDKNWRKEIQSASLENPVNFVKFIANKYKSNMTGLGYKVQDTFQQIRNPEKNVPLYYLAFFSKHIRGNQFWNIVKKYSNPQGSLFD